MVEGLRIVDEWPTVKSVITSYQMTFEKLKSPPKPNSNAIADAIDDAISSQSGANDLGPTERRVFSLYAPDRDVRTLIDLSCLGEFETCQALSNLVKLGYFRPIAPAGASEIIDAADISPWHALVTKLGGSLARGALVARRRARSDSNRCAVNSVVACAGFFLLRSGAPEASLAAAVGAHRTEFWLVWKLRSATV